MREQFYQIIDVMLLGEETVDVDSHGAMAVEHRGRQPCFAAAFDELL